MAHLDRAGQPGVGGDVAAQALARAGVGLHGEHAPSPTPREHERVEAALGAEVEARRARYAELLDDPGQLQLVEAQPHAGVAVEVDLHDEPAAEPERQAPWLRRAREHRAKHRLDAVLDPDQSAVMSSVSVMASSACCAASSDDSLTSTFWGASSVAVGWCSTAVSSTVSIPAASRMACISSASVMSSASATWTIRLTTTVPPQSRRRLPSERAHRRPWPHPPSPAAASLAL